QHHHGEEDEDADGLADHAIAQAHDGIRDGGYQPGAGGVHGGDTGQTEHHGGPPVDVAHAAVAPSAHQAGEAHNEERIRRGLHRIDVEEVHEDGHREDAA